MDRELHLKTACWDCPSVENRRVINPSDRKTLAALSDSKEVKRLMEEMSDDSEKPRYVLPVVQNLEALVFGTRLTGDENYSTSFEYCVERPEDIEEFEFDLLHSPMVQAVIRTISDYSKKPPVLEAEAPFSVLAGIMNPVDLYLLLTEEKERLLRILHKIAEASADYLKACVTAGCRIISLADPAGTMDLVGEKYYRTVCGEAALYLMHQCEPFTDKAVIHVCRKMSQSLLIAGLVKVQRYESDRIAGIKPDFEDVLSEMADNPEIHFTGMTCIHSGISDPNESDMNTPYILRI